VADGTKDPDRGTFLKGSKGSWPRDISAVRENRKVGRCAEPKCDRWHCGDARAENASRPKSAWCAIYGGVG